MSDSIECKSEHKELQVLAFVASLASIMLIAAVFILIVGVPSYVVAVHQPARTAQVGDQEVEHLDGGCILAHCRCSLLLMLMVLRYLICI